MYGLAVSYIGNGSTTGPLPLIPIGGGVRLMPSLGYAQATQIAKEALESGRGVYEVVLEKKLMSRDELDRVLNPKSMV